MNANRPNRIDDPTILHALRNKTFFGLLPAFRSLASWGRWIVFLKATYGLPLDAGEVEVFRYHTGREAYDPPAGGWPEIVCVSGRQSGKTRIAGLIAAFEAIRQPAGAETYAILVAQDQRGAIRTLFRYASAPFDKIPVLRRSVANRTAETLSLDNGVTLAAYPCRPAGIRGPGACVAIADELAFFKTTEGNPTDTEMLRAVRPMLWKTGGKLIVLSSPYGQAGALFDLVQKYHGRDDAPVLIWRATAPEMNPTLPNDYLARMERDDPDAYRSEVLGEFRAGVKALFDPAALRACVAEAIRERLPAGTLRYYAFVDVSGGRRDAFALAIAHRDKDGRAVLDVIRVWPAPFNPSGVVAEAADLLRSYRITEVTGDNYGAELVAEAFRARQIRYVASERDRSAIYLTLVPYVNAKAVVLLDVPDLLREFVGLQRFRGVSGRDRVDHPRAGHDDAANAAAGALTLAAKPNPGFQIYVC